eukprot:CAMPEP_0206218058 /NCGR_PEP_ID=MMETSP0047_2-20121206/3599_1 /ASSEMBLY_ACC=CAM_ASM_000192 /TAXON_ID=195065 /ORGANISM="Chroomonas mesostigmatica_cf, Strain CCMP1168" /LENGTH=485 /DNA_ID=CAMNT_0053640541 /DNA_START=1 /DNA_END=1458 /DNA_ORIENTATION=+
MDFKDLMKKDLRVKDRVARGMYLWTKKNVTITGERIAKVDRVAAQMAKLIVQLRDGGVPLHGYIVLSEFLKWARALCSLADAFVSSKPMGCGITFAIDRDGTAYVDKIAQGSDAASSSVRVGDELIKIDGQDAYRTNFQDIAQMYLGRLGTEVDFIFRRHDQPHPVHAKLYRTGDTHSEIRCKKHPHEIIERVRHLEVSLLKIRFGMEEWGLKDPEERIGEIAWQKSIMENELCWLNHRCLRLCRDLGLKVIVGKQERLLDYDRAHTIRDPFAQMVWASYFPGCPCAKTRDFIAAVQNELRNLGFNLMTAPRSSFLAKLMDCSLEDCVSQVDVQSMIDHWYPFCRWSEAETFKWEERGHGLMDALFLAEANVLDKNKQEPEWFHPFTRYQEVCHLLSSADPGTFALRYSQRPGHFVIQWCSPGRQLKSAKVYVTKGGYAWREDGKIVYPNLQVLIREAQLFLNKGMRYPTQKTGIAVELIGPDDD